MRTLALIVVCAVACLATASARDLVPNREVCDHLGWRFLPFARFHFGTSNACVEPIAIWFMLKDGAVIRATVQPGGMFDTGLTKGELGDKTLWAAATCPAGYAPDPALSAATFDRILKSRYRCVR